MAKGPVPEGDLLIDRVPTTVNTAKRIGAQQSDKLRAVDDWGRGSTNGATAARTPMNLPSWYHVAQLCDSFRFRGGSRPLAMLKAVDAHAYKQLPLGKAYELSAFAPLRNPMGEIKYSLAPRTQLFGSAGAVLCYTCSPRVMAVLTCEYLKIPCVGYYDDFGIVAPRAMAKLALLTFTNFYDEPFLILKRNKSEADSNLDFSKLTISSRDEVKEVIASLALSKERIDRFIALARELRVAYRASLATLPKLAGQLRFAQTAVVGMFGRAAVQPVYELIARGGGGSSRVMGSCIPRRDGSLPNIAPRLAICSFREDPPNPARILSGATGEGGLGPDPHKFIWGSLRNAALACGQRKQNLHFRAVCGSSDDL